MDTNCIGKCVEKHYIWNITQGGIPLITDIIYIGKICVEKYHTLNIAQGDFPLIVDTNYNKWVEKHYIEIVHKG